jgi:hypothetical protein
MRFSVRRGVERPTGIEPVAPAWEAGVLPLYEGRFESNDARPTPIRGELSLESVRTTTKPGRSLDLAGELHPHTAAKKRQIRPDR